GQRFHVQERFLGLLISPSDVILFLNELFPTKLTGIKIVRFNDIDDPIRRLNEHIHSDLLYVDKHLKSGFLLKLMKLNPLLKVELDDLADRIRSIKDKDEIETMRIASQINDAVMSEVEALCVPGVLEKEIASQIEDLFISKGATSVSFPPIIAFGTNTADPHAVPNDTELKEGMPVIIDMGCLYQGYCSDMTRSFIIGENKKMEEIYQIVKKANLAAIDAVRPGVLLKDIDKAARDVIRDAGYGDAFIHRTGHGIGQDVHEPFDVSSNSEVVAQVGMIFSIEPGIYLPSLGGIRIEDLVIVTEDGCEVLNHYKK
ncbi:MAG: aminopeptidase P family protein, partial [Bacilli bacterium]|nr:aminopeptidase P family protein [Bacilli bacterium]